MRPLRTSDWILGILSVERKRVGQLNELFGRATETVVWRLRCAGRIYVSAWIRSSNGGPAAPLYRTGTRRDAQRPAPLTNAERLSNRRARHARMRRGKKDGRRVQVRKSRAEICRDYRARTKARAASVFQWRGPLRPRKPQPMKEAA